MKKRIRLFISMITLIVTAVALSIGVFSAGSRTISISGTISFSVTSVSVRISSTVENAYEDAFGDKTLQELGTKRNIIIQNFDESWAMQPVFSIVDGSPGIPDAFLEGTKWNVSALYFNPNASTPSYEDPASPPIPATSPTISLKMLIANYSLIPVKVTVTVDQSSALEEIGGVSGDPAVVQEPFIGYDLTDANIANIPASNVARSNVSSAQSTIYLKLNVLDVDFSSLNFNFTVLIEPYNS